MAMAPQLLPPQPLRPQLLPPQVLPPQLLPPKVLPPPALAPQVVPHPSLHISPDKGKLAADDTLDLEVSYVCGAPGVLSTTLEVEVQGNKPIRLPFM